MASRYTLYTYIEKIWHFSNIKLRGNKRSRRAEWGGVGGSEVIGEDSRGETQVFPDCGLQHIYTYISEGTTVFGDDAQVYKYNTMDNNRREERLQHFV
jgi:hypothetical protein